MRKKYNDQQIKDAVKQNTSVSGVMRTLGISVNSSSSHTHLSKRIKRLNLDTSHFKGLASNRGTHIGGRKPRAPQEILILKIDGNKEHSRTLRRALIDIGRKEECVCGLGTVWQDKPLVLQVEHKNGNSLDDRPENLTFLCPNCHTQTDTWGSRKRHADVVKLAYTTG
jgi:heterodisulfide reductase subunit B